MTAFWFIIGITGSIILILMAKQIQRSIKDHNAKMRKLAEKHAAERKKLAEEAQTMQNEIAAAQQAARVQERARQDIEILSPKLRELEGLTPELGPVRQPPGISNWVDLRLWVSREIERRQDHLVNKTEQKRAIKEATKSRFELLEIE